MMSNGCANTSKFVNHFHFQVIPLFVIIIIVIAYILIWHSFTIIMNSCC